jgi:hypothetical protein
MGSSSTGGPLCSNCGGRQFSHQVLEGYKKHDVKANHCFYIWCWFYLKSLFHLIGVLLYMSGLWMFECVTPSVTQLWIPYFIYVQNTAILVHNYVVVYLHSSFTLQNGTTGGDEELIISFPDDITVMWVFWSYPVGFFCNNQ